MRASISAAILAAAVATTALPAISFAQVHPPAPAEKPVADQQAVPIKQVVLYTSGVGYFEHYGTVKGDGFTELHFKTTQINDILKSLLLEDLDKGKISSVTYGSQEPLAHTLKSFEVDLSAAPPLNELLAQLRGASVTASLAGGPVSGKILSVEKKQKPAGDKQLMDVWMVNLLLAGGSIKPVELDAVVEIKLDDAKLQQELVKALSAVAASRDQDSKPVAIRFSGQGDRRVRIGYVVEAPVWKASYRLVLSADAKNEKPGEGAKDKGAAEPGKVNGPTEEKGAPPETAPKNPAQGGGAAADAEGKGGSLQGWAIVENQTDNDWENVQLSLVSGRPISFVEDLYQPLFIARPVVEPELYASLRPQRYAGGLGVAQNGAADAAAPPAPAPPAVEMEQAGSGGGGTAYFGTPGGRRGLARQNMQQAAAKNGLAYNGPIDITKSVSSLASGASVGEFFQYTVGDVSLPRQKSAMIPIIADTVKTTRLSIYNAGVLPDHPLLGARLTNTTGKLLPQGPITVLDGGTYAGDATIEDLPNTQSRLLSYGIDQNVLVHNNDQTNDSTLVTARIVKGVLELTNKQIFRQNYVAQNKGKADRTLLVEHPRRQGWKLVQPDHAQETTDALYRFEETVAANETKTLTVQEELVASQGIAILPMDLGQIDVYLRTAQVPEEVKKSLQAVAKLKFALVDTQRQMEDRQRQINDITQEQNRIRENMKAVSQSSDYYKRLEKELDAQETQLQKLKDESKTLRQTQEKQQKDLEASLLEMSAG